MKVVVSLRPLAPRGTDRRFALKLVREVARSPSTLRHRVNRENILIWRQHRRRWMRCNICGHEGTILYEMPDLARYRQHRIAPHREALRCRGCNSSMRTRMVAAGLLAFLNERYCVPASTIDELALDFPADVQVLDTDAHSHIAKRLARSPNYLRSLYVEDRDNGTDLGSGVINVDLTQMPFADTSIDLIITSEVMEHVRHLDTAHREIARCLRPNGVYLFTVPYDPNLTHTWRLIDEETDENLVEPPHIHGDPFLRARGIKSYRVFGRDICSDMEVTGLETTFTPIHRPELGIFEGDLFRSSPRGEPAH